MKTNIIRILLLLDLLVTASARANTPLTFGDATLYGAGGPCWDDTLVSPAPHLMTSTFALSGLQGTGVVSSAVSTVVNNVQQPTGQHMFYTYSVDMSQFSPGANHCLKLLIHFGTPLGCSYEVLVLTNGSGADVTSASKAAYGDITFTFGSGCLSPGQSTATLGMLSDTPPKTNSVTLIDDYTDPASGSTNEARIQVSAIVPDIPPNWAFSYQAIPSLLLQGQLSVVTNPVPRLTNTGPYDVTIQLFDSASNGLPVGPLTTQTVQVVNGLFNMPVPGDPASLNGGGRWLGLGVRPSGLPAVQFTPLTSRLPISPAPQAFYAYSAGVVADIGLDQAVTSLNGLTGGVTLQGGEGITITGNGNIITISGNAGFPSDRNIKTGFGVVRPVDILDKLAALPLTSWRYTNEVAGIRHVGPTAQDFHSAFGLGSGDTSIGMVDEAGVALAAIQGLNEKLKEKDARIDALEKRLADLEQLVRTPAQK